MTGAEDGRTDRGAPQTVLAGTGEVELVLASASTARNMLLTRAGVPFRADPANIDEAEVKASLKAEGATAMQAAETLAELKARHVSRRHAGALVIGALSELFGLRWPTAGAAVLTLGVWLYIWQRRRRGIVAMERGD